jgi:hypothetical protein
MPQFAEQQEDEKGQQILFFLKIPIYKIRTSQHLLSVRIEKIQHQRGKWLMQNKTLPSGNHR